MEMIPGVMSVDNNKTITKMADEDSSLGKDDFL